VFCGSSMGTRPIYVAQARELGRLLARRGLGLVYGGASIGLMGAIADAALAEGGKVVGVIPRGLQAKEVGHRSLTRLHVVSTMHERKALMAELSDGFIAMPGGMGTLEETAEILTWAQLGIHGKPCGLLDVGGYYQHLVAFLDHAVGERFLREEHRALVLVERDPRALLARMEAFAPLRVERWIDRDAT